MHSYNLQSIITTQRMQWHCYPLLHWYNNPKTGLYRGPTSKCNVYLSLFPKFFLCPQNHTSILHSTFSSHYAPYSYEPSSKLQTSPILLVKSMLEWPQYASQTCTKTCIILTTKISLLLIYSIGTMVVGIQGESKRKQKFNKHKDKRRQ